MELSFNIKSPYTETPQSGPVKIGWLYSQNKGSLIFDPPTRLKSKSQNKKHAKSASRCPAVLGLESRYFEVKCPFDLQLKYEPNANGRPSLVNLLGDNSPVRPTKLREHVSLTDQSEWRYPDRPTVQLNLPYIFIADEPVYMTQLAPFLHYNPKPWPGTIFPGRFPIHIWPRSLSWGFEWHDIDQPLILKRGEPLFYLTFETAPQDRSIQLVEAENTPELQEYSEMIHGAVNYVNQTFSLFKTAEERRPTKLLTPKER